MRNLLESLLNVCVLKLGTYNKMKNVAKRIKEVRVSKGMSLDDLADNMQLSAEEVRKIEDGETKLTLDLISEFAIALEVTEHFLKT